MATLFKGVFTRKALVYYGYSLDGMFSIGLFSHIGRKVRESEFTIVPHRLSILELEFVFVNLRRPATTTQILRAFSRMDVRPATLHEVFGEIRQTESYGMRIALGTLSNSFPGHVFPFLHKTSEGTEIDLTWPEPDGKWSPILNTFVGVRIRKP